MPHDLRRILIVDDDAVAARSLADTLAEHGYDCVIAGGSAQALRLSERGDADDESPFSVLLVDLEVGRLSEPSNSSEASHTGLDLIRTLRERNVDAVPVVISGYGSIESAVETIRLGAIDYLMKPVVDQELLIAVEKAFNQYVLLSENTNLRRRLDARLRFDDILGNDPRMQRMFETIEAVAPTRTTVLMSGESGTGKSLIARAIHRNSPRAEAPYVELSCGSIPETLLESELFGHVKGAFTGAHADKQGRFLTAHTGTIFLDEINSASPAMQLKLLRVLQERRFEPVGSTETVEVDVRVILASNEPLEHLVARGEFRQDLYYRINVVMIQLPPLRERIGDIPLLAEHFIAAHAKQAGKEILGLTEEAMHALRNYAFPGNVRELENIIERAIVLTRSPRIQLSDLPQHVIDNSTVGLLPEHARGGESAWKIDEWRPMPLAEALREPEKQIILAALNANDWNRQKTADDLQINRSTLYKKIKQYGLDREYGETG